MDTKVEKQLQKTEKEWVGICAIFFIDRVEEMMMNASCFVILFLVK